MNYVYSPSDNAFYYYPLKDDYDAAGTWPEDGIEVEDSVVTEFNGNYPPGKMRAPDKNGYPSWIDIPPLSDEEQLQNNTNTRDYLINNATVRLTPLQTKLLMGRKLTAAETKLVNELLDYIDALSAVDLKNPEWPVEPA